MSDADKRRMEAHAKDFGKRVKRLRMQMEPKMTQEGLAAAAGLHRTHTLLIETGKREPRLRTILALAVALKCQPAALMPYMPSIRQRVID